jgi:hypothetical protein
MLMKQKGTTRKNLVGRFFCKKVILCSMNESVQLPASRTVEQAL